jgi:PAS domain S-box-containing protein
MKPNHNEDMSVTDTSFSDSILKIFLVEDNPGDVFIIKDFLTNSGFKHILSQTSRLSEARRLSEEQEFDVILLDLGLPDSFGLETLRNMVASKNKAPIIVLTGLDDEVVAVESLKEGAQDYLVKNRLNSEYIIHAIKYGIERKKIQEIQKKHTRQFSILSSATTVINACESISSIYRVICSDIKILLDESFVVGIVITHNKTAKIIDSEGLEPYFEQIRFFTGKYLHQNNFKLNRDNNKLIGLLEDEKIHEIEGGIYEIVLHNYSQDICTEIEKMLGINHTYAISFLRNKTNYGGIVILSKKVISNDDINIIEAISNQASLNIHRRTVENELRISENNFRELNEGLELQIHDRTIELAKVNDLLNDELEERRAKEVQLDKLNRTLSALGKSSQAMVRASNESKYLDEVCKIIIEDCGHAMVWIGFAENNESMTVRPMANAGFEEGYIENLNVKWSDTERGRGPTGTAIRTGKVTICKNMLTDERFAPWRDDAIKRGYASSISLPLMTINKAFGAITIYSREEDPFSDGEIALLTEIANDLAYGIGSIKMQLARTKAEKELHHTKNYLESLINYSNAPVIVWNSKSEIQIFNRAFEHLTGYSSSEVVGKNLDFLFPDKTIKETNNKINDALSGNYWESIEIPILCKNNEIKTVLWNSANIYDDDCITLISTIAQGNDITEKKKADEKLTKYASDLKELNATKDKFFGIIAHDLKNPFSSILAASELLAAKSDQFETESIIKFSKILNEASKSAYALLENLLEWSRAQTGSITYNPQEVDIGEMVNKNLTHVEVSAANKKIKLLSKVTEDIKAIADKNMLNTVLRNLLINAVKFTHKGGKVMVAAQKNGKFLTLMVKDSGIGIPKKDIKKLFRIDTKYTNIGTAQERGTGLGLLLCKEFVERHGGKIWVESNVGKGSEFMFTIPLNIKINRTSV